MQKEFTENWSKLCQSMSKPMIDLTELNINTLNNLSRNTSAFEELSQAKKPEEFMHANLKVANAAFIEATRYAQKALEIGLNAVSETGRIWSDSVNKATNRAADFTKAKSNQADKNRE